MESLKLKQLHSQLRKQERKQRRKEIRKINSKFNLGKSSDGNIITSTSNPKAHTYNKLMRRINKERDDNFNKMLEAFYNGEISKKEPVKLSKGHKTVLFKKSIQKAEETRSFIKKICEFISEGADMTNNGPKVIYLCQMK